MKKKCKCDCKCDTTPTIDVFLKCVASGTFLAGAGYYIYYLATTYS